MNDDEHKLDLDDLFKRLNTTEHGLTGEDAWRRQKRYGPNLLETAKRAPLIVRFGKHLFNFFAILLWIGSILAFVSKRLFPGTGNYYIGIALAGVIFLNASLSALQIFRCFRESQYTAYSTSGCSRSHLLRFPFASCIFSCFCPGYMR